MPAEHEASEAMIALTAALSTSAHQSVEVFASFMSHLPGSYPPKSMPCFLMSVVSVTNNLRVITLIYFHWDVVNKATDCRCRMYNVDKFLW